MAQAFEGVTVIDHPLVQHKLTIMRDAETSTRGFQSRKAGQPWRESCDAAVVSVFLACVV